MKVNKNILFFLLTICFSVSSFAQYIQVNDTYTAQQLVENVLIQNSPCANVSNFSVSGGNFGTGENSFGYFTAGSSAFPFANGIILSTGKANSAPGPNTSILSEDAPGWNGDSDLENALGVSGTSDATILEFDFTPVTSKVSFDYIFASEEYHGTASCRYSDGFAFLLKPVGSTSPYQNLALVPNTTTPVEVTTVHPDMGGGCGPINASYFGSLNGSGDPINFNGQTVVMTAKATVVPGTTYHIKLVIADEANPLYDSAIFLGGGSFNVGADLGPDRLISTLNPICQGNTYLLNATETGTNTYKWYKNNVVIPGETNPTYLVTVSGIYKVEVTLGSSACIATGEVIIEYSPLPSLINTTIVQCDDNNDGITPFNLTKVDGIIKNSDPSLGPVMYYENLADAQSQNTVQAIANPTNYQSAPKTIYASVSNSFGCSNTATVLLQISNNTVTFTQPLETCDLDLIDGYYDFNLSNADVKVLIGLPPGLVVEYYPTINDALLQTNQLPNNYRNTIQFMMTIYAKIVNGSDCYGIVPVELYVNSIDPNIVADETVPSCDGLPQILAVDPIFTSYAWSTTETTSSIIATLPGTYTVSVIDSNTCQATKQFFLVESTSPAIISVTINDFEENENTILINYTGVGNNTFSIDGIHYQDSPYFTNVPAGRYTVWVKNGCGSNSQIIYVLNYPKFFTPNGDGFNDLWTIENICTIPNTKITIYDRYGKLVYQFKGNEKGWDGQMNSKNLPATDYWFVISLETGRIIKGHFTLKR
jgi:gliding motility-associated-like protein